MDSKTTWHITFKQLKTKYEEKILKEYRRIRLNYRRTKKKKRELESTCVKNHTKKNQSEIFLIKKQNCISGIIYTKRLLSEVMGK